MDEHGFLYQALIYLAAGVVAVPLLAARERHMLQRALP